MSDKNLLKNTEFLRGLISIGVVAFLVSIFELVLYYVVIKKTFVEAINNMLDNVQIYDLEDSIGGDSMVNMLRGLSENDAKLAEYVNTLKMWIIILELGVILFFILWAYNKLKRNSRTEIFGTNLWPVAVNVLFIFMILMSFQLIIFQFSKSFNYGSDEEMDLRVVNAFLKTKGEPLIDLPSGTSLVKQKV